LRTGFNFSFKVSQVGLAKQPNKNQILIIIKTMYLAEPAEKDNDIIDIKKSKQKAFLCVLYEL
jgi:hypothetical protein